MRGKYIFVQTLFTLASGGKNTFPLKYLSVKYLLVIFILFYLYAPLGNLPVFY